MAKKQEMRVSPRTGKLVNMALSHNNIKRFKTVEDLENALEFYFMSCEKEEPSGEFHQSRPYSVARLSLHLNMSRRVFLRYCNGEADYFAPIFDAEGKVTRDAAGKIKRANVSFTETMQRALTRIEAFNEECLFTSKNTDGPKFALKNNHRWRDQVDISPGDGGPIKLEAITTQMSDEEAMKVYTDNIKSSQKQ